MRPEILYTYKGYRYEVILEKEDDCWYFIHTIESPLEDSSGSLDFDSYTWMSRRDFQAMVDIYEQKGYYITRLDLPGSISPLTNGQPTLVKAILGL